MTLLKTVPVCVLDREMAFNQDVKALQPGPEILPEYLPYLILGNTDHLRSLVDPYSRDTEPGDSTAMS